ncbi:NAD-dependent epimerase/dehydratase family protein [Spirosoma rhododendri]|uniref:NAD-dependent epimerase/dehydratase family protein n=1 Tax=Spirosoma rhododendri TaxID=2728024 RepID=A0A7L5DHD1_9BACT|nr:NAD-dependent epimerase/dehydratase family protein [Spirosoma rhododendri]QJD77425.1 NAD-dependent epimerase/dehydratase family protein [Spirosoma rhododendri]
MNQTVLLTGANGFLGSHLTRELLRRGYAVRAFVRSRTNSPTLANLPIELVEGDILDADALDRAATGCDAVIHAAALAQVNPARSPALWAVNQTGTANVIRAVQQAGVGRLVYVGTANVFGFGTLDLPGDETTLFAGHRYGSDYIDSKRAATLLVEQAVRETGLPAVLVHPTFMLGSLDAKPTSGQLLLELYRGRLIGYPAGGKNYVHVQDVATATVNALTQGRIGESYILGHQNLSYRDAFRLMAERMNVQPPRLSLPPALARLYGYGCDAWTRLTGRPAPVNSAMVAVANDGHYFQSRKAIAELGLTQTPIETAIDEAFDWFNEHDYVTRRTR